MADFAEITKTEGFNKPNKKREKTDFPEPDSPKRPTKLFKEKQKETFNKRGFLSTKIESFSIVITV